MATATPDAPVSVICFDFDGFKQVNDTIGHAAGDDILRWAVTSCYRVLPADALVSRLGGDEFVVVLPRTDAAAAADAAGRIAAALAERIPASAGTATGVGAEDLPALLEIADRRLYRDKARRGRTPNRDTAA